MQKYIQVNQLISQRQNKQFKYCNLTLLHCLRNFVSLRLWISTDNKYLFLCINLVANNSLIMSLVTSMRHLQTILILRETDGYFILSANTNIRQKCMRHSGPRLWNQLPCDIRRAVSLPIFK